METAGYAALTRQSGLMREMQLVANNIANSATGGYRQEGLVFSEYVNALPVGPSLSMARAQAHYTSATQGALSQTNGAFDLAIEGEGFFLVETPLGVRLTRAGNFSPAADGNLVSADGFRVLDAGETPIFIPPGTKISVSSDGTISSDGQPISQIAIVQPEDGTALIREDGVMFRSDSGVQVVESPRVTQGFLENSNVDPISQIARMITVQRAYELGQSFLEAEDQRIRNAVKSLAAR